MKNKINSAIILFLIFSITIYFINACNNRFVPTQPNLNVVISSANCRMIQHAMGETCIPDNPKRVITISQFTLGNALTLGVKPIGSTIFISPGISQSFPAHLKNKTEGIKPVGGQFQPNLETILLLKPDLIVGWEPVKAVYHMLSKIAPTVLGDWQGLQASWREHFDFVAQVLRKEKVAQAAWNNYYQRIQELKTALGDRYQNQEISVVNIRPHGIDSYVKNSFCGSIINDAGLQRSKAQNVNLDTGSIEISQEELDKVDGDILFVMTGDGDVDKNQLLKNIQKKQLWKKLRAVQQNQVYFVDSSTWYAGGATLLAADAVIDDLYKYLVNTP